VGLGYVGLSDVRGVFDAEQAEEVGFYYKTL